MLEEGLKVVETRTIEKYCIERNWLLMAPLSSEIRQ
jgi:hypothetical protein